ncbi:MAG: DUF5915 domain-containing protein, partial [Candidatus Latescibacterota bacterium]
EVVFVEDASVLTEAVVSLNFRLLGVKYGRDVPALRAAIEALDPAEVASRVAQGSEILLRLEEREIALLPEEIVVETKPRVGLRVVEEDGCVVALNTELTEDLEDEGFARELVHRIQNMRKEAGFEVSDRITLLFRTTPRLEQAIEAFRDYIQAETLCQSLERGGGDDLASVERLSGQELHIGIRKAIGHAQ